MSSPSVDLVGGSGVVATGGGLRTDEGLLKFDTNEKVKVVKSFEAMGLTPEMLRGIFACGFERPSEIQKRAILPILSRRDCVCQAQSGTGKTATFSIGILQSLDTRSREPQALVLAPTRELAIQIGGVLRLLGQYQQVSVQEITGGKQIAGDIKKIESGVQVVSGTPGRIVDMIKRRHLRTKAIHMLVIDEADEILTQGFTEQIFEIFRYLPETVQVVLVSATLPKVVHQIAEQFMEDPIRILVRRDEIALDKIRQFFIAVEREEWKFDTLCDLYSTLTISQAVIFCNSRRKVEWLAVQMRKQNFTVAHMHGDMDQAERNAVMTSFRSSEKRVLITTDMWARGIDVPQVSLVINYDLPSNKENYIHRIGRSGRFGRRGVAISLITSEDVITLKDIEKHYQTHINEMPVQIADYL